MYIRVKSYKRTLKHPSIYSILLLESLQHTVQEEKRPVAFAEAYRAARPTFHCYTCMSTQRSVPAYDPGHKKSPTLFKNSTKVNLCQPFCMYVFVKY